MIHKRRRTRQLTISVPGEVPAAAVLAVRAGGARGAAGLAPQAERLLIVAGPVGRGEGQDGQHLGGQQRHTPGQ